MRSETILDLLDSASDTGAGTRSRTLPGLSAEDIASLKAQGNSIAALAAETTSKEYAALKRHWNVTSYSILQELHACPRSLVLDRLAATASGSEERIPNIDFVFGHAVGAGVQAALAFDNQLDAALYATFVSWYGSFELGHEDYNVKKKKSIESAILAVESFVYWRAGALADWELFYLPTGKPAIELSFAVAIGGGWYCGHIDCILRNTRTGRIAVGEIKTSGYSNIDDALYRNSSQALGYSLVLDQIVGAEADYDVIYMVYSAPQQEWNLLPFAKSVHQKLEWVQDRLIDVGHIKQYQQLAHYPKNGASCIRFNKRCIHYGSCDLVDRNKVAELPALNTVEELPNHIDYVFDVQQLLTRQVEGFTGSSITATTQEQDTLV